MKVSVITASVLLLACISLVAADGNGGLYRVFSTSDCASDYQIGFIWIDPAGDSVGNRTIGCTLADDANGLYYTFDPLTTIDPNFNAKNFSYFGQFSSTNIADCPKLNYFGGKLSTCIAAPLANKGWATFLMSKCDGTSVSFDYGTSSACAYLYNYAFTSGECYNSDNLIGLNGCAVRAPVAAPVDTPVAAPVAQNTPTAAPKATPTAPTAAPTAAPKGKVAAGSSVVAGIFSLAGVALLF